MIPLTESEFHAAAQATGYVQGIVAGFLGDNWSDCERIRDGFPKVNITDESTARRDVMNHIIATCEHAARLLRQKC
jgi:hypothetical protein